MRPGTVKLVKPKKVSVSSRLPPKPEALPMPGRSSCFSNVPLRRWIRTSDRASRNVSQTNRSPTTLTWVSVASDCGMSSFQAVRSGVRVSMAMRRPRGALRSVRNQNTGPSLPTKL